MDKSNVLDIRQLNKKRRRLKRYSTQVLNQYGLIIGIITKGKVYDIDKNLLGKIVKEEESDDEIFATEVVSGEGKIKPNGRRYSIVDLKDDLIGIIDVNNNIFLNGEVYFGTIKKQTQAFLFLILLVLAALLAATAGYAIYLFESVGVSASENDHPIINIVNNENLANWENDGELNIFSDRGKDDDRIIYPGATGNYSFIINNDNDSIIEYVIALYDKNEQSIPVKYRLRIGNSYVMGNSSTWVSINEMKVDKLLLLERSRALFTLEWTWEETDDAWETSLGVKGIDTYTLEIVVTSTYYYG